ncbi:MAG: DMP19 family protein [Oscillospiraceae bacterium]|nr:DMP19 family protein [Oscillospiraceae bacterium]
MANEKNYDELWDEYSGKFNKKLVFDCGSDWSKLDETEQEIAALWKLVVDTNNGGFEQFFTNWGYECYWYAMRGIQKIGDRTLLELLHGTYMNVFDKFREDTRLTYYSDIFDYLTEEDEDILRDTNIAFWEEHGERLCEEAYKYYSEKLGKPIDN